MKFDFFRPWSRKSPVWRTAVPGVIGSVFGFAGVKWIEESRRFNGFFVSSATSISAWRWIKNAWSSPDVARAWLSGSVARNP